MERTTIELSTEIREWLQEERLPSESSYDDTLRRFRGDERGNLWTENEIREIAREEIQEATRR